MFLSALYTDYPPFDCVANDVMLTFHVPCPPAAEAILCHIDCFLVILVDPDIFVDRGAMNSSTCLKRRSSSTMHENATYSDFDDAAALILQIRENQLMAPFAIITASPETERRVSRQVP